MQFILNIRIPKKTKGQSMYIWPGIKLQSYKTESVKNKHSNFVIKNGLFYMIKMIKEGKITIIKLNNDDLPEGDEMFMLLEDVSCNCLLYTSPSPRDRQKSRMPSSA